VVRALTRVLSSFLICWAMALPSICLEVLSVSVELIFRVVMVLKYKRFVMLLLLLILLLLLVSVFKENCVYKLNDC